MSNVTAMQPRRAPGAAPRALLYAPDNRYLERLAARLDGFAELHWQDSRDIAPGLLAPQAQHWRVVLLDYSSGNASYSSELARQLHAQAPELSLVAIGTASADQASTVLAALRAGVRDFIDIDSPADEIQATLQHILSHPPLSRGTAAAHAAAAPRTQGRLVVLLGSRAGVGTTTLAAHLGAQLATASGTAGDTEPRGLLLDLGLPAGDAGLYLDAEPKFHVDDAQRHLTRIDATLARSAMAHHRSGLAVLGHRAASWPAPFDPGALGERLREVFQLVLCDLGGVAPPQLPLALLRQAAEIWIVTDQSIAASVSLDALLAELGERGLRDARLRLVVNRYEDADGISAARLAERFELPLLATLPERTRALRAAATESRLLSDARPGDPYLRALAPLLQRLGASVAPDTGAGAWTRLARHLSTRPWKAK